MRQAVYRAGRDKFDTVHENETGYILVLASALMSHHDANETGFFFRGKKRKTGADGMQGDVTG